MACPFTEGLTNISISNLDPLMMEMSIEERPSQVQEPLSSPRPESSSLPDSEINDGEAHTAAEPLMSEPAEITVTMPQPEKNGALELDSKHPEDNEEDGANESEASEAEAQERKPKITKRKMEQMALLDAWHTTKKQEPIKDPESLLHATNEDLLSIRHLMANKESAMLVDRAREYQIELFERAKENNVIAVLDTGSGKTLIAILLLRHIFEKELEDRSNGKRGRISFFLVGVTTLVYQQYAVLNCNLDQQIDCLCGEMNVDAWDKSTWKDRLEGTMAIVCTAEILFNCLSQGLITMDRINILIFDEAHNAKKNHAYARIMRDFYDDLRQEDRPRIFGMTASPGDSKEDIKEACEKLEKALHCKIITTKDISLMRSVVSQPKELVRVYDQLPRPFMTPLCQELHGKLGKINILRSFFEGAKVTAAELGTYCADSTLLSELSEETSVIKLEMRLSQRPSEQRTALERESIDRDTHAIQEVYRDMRCSPYLSVAPDLETNISSKVLELMSYIRELYEANPQAKCIVFVERRITARALLGLFRRIGFLRLRMDLLMGLKGSVVGDHQISMRQQVQVVRKFRSNELDLIFATSIAEEGLDIPSCNAVVRFDLCTTLTQFIQSRGRARHKNSQYVHMIEMQNGEHYQLLSDARRGENIMRTFCSNLPEDRLLQGSEDAHIPDSYTKRTESWRDESTGAKLTYASALTVLARFAAALPRHEDMMGYVTYFISPYGKDFRCEIILPETSPLRTFTGGSQPRKKRAKCDAAYKMCLALRKAQYLDEHFLPIYQKQLPEFRNARLAVSLKSTNEYGMMTKPEIWQKSLEPRKGSLFVTVIELSDHAALGRPQDPLALVTRLPLPEFPVFPVFIRPREKCDVKCYQLRDTLEDDPETISQFTLFTLHLFRDIFNKTFEHDEAQMVYWIAPCVGGTQISVHMSAKELIDWKSLSFINTHDYIEKNADVSMEHFEDRYLIDIASGALRYFSTRHMPDMRATDPVPASCPKHENHDSILDYSSGLWPKARAKVSPLWKREQPVYLGEQLSSRYNWLSDWESEEADFRSSVYLCIEPLQVSSISTSIVAISYFLPAIVTRLESYLIALEACNLLNIEVKLDLALEAMTKDSDNTEEHKAEQIHVQRGMGKNYERLEFLGDSFLKMATSIGLYSLYNFDNEFEFHVKRMVMVCNENLLKKAMPRDLMKFIRTEGFNRRTWYPESLKLLRGKKINKPKDGYKHHLKDKTIADVCEALIGASLLTFHESGNMDMAVKAVTVMVQNPDHNFMKWADYYSRFQAPSWQLEPPLARHIDLAKKIEEQMKYKFENPRLLCAAFTHPSYPYSKERIPSYQRLEFLGDSLLELACVNYLFHKYPNKDPQWLTEHKMAMVSNKFLGALCVKLQFHKYLRSVNDVLIAKKTEYASEIRETEEQNPGARDYWNMTGSPPKCLPDVVEAYIGAIFVDSKFSFEVVTNFFNEHIRWFFEDMTIYDTFANTHPTTFLTNHLTLTLRCTNFGVLSKATEVGPEEGLPRSILAAVICHKRVVADAEASNGKNAKVRASQNALKVLREMSPAEYKREFACDCTEEAVERQLRECQDRDGDSDVENGEMGHREPRRREDRLNGDAIGDPQAEEKVNGERAEGREEPGSESETKSKSKSKQAAPGKQFMEKFVGTAI